jgi:hypothetical protein
MLLYRQVPVVQVLLAQQGWPEAPQGSQLPVIEPKGIWQE